MAVSAATELHVADEGTAIRIRLLDGGTVVDISPAAGKTMQLKFKKPSGVVVVKAASFTTDGIDGKLEYVTETGAENILDEAGEWRVQAFIEFVTGKWHSEVLKMLVRENLS